MLNSDDSQVIGGGLDSSTLHVAQTADPESGVYILLNDNCIRGAQLLAGTIQWINEDEVEVTGIVATKYFDTVAECFKVARDNRFAQMTSEWTPGRPSVWQCLSNMLSDKTSVWIYTTVSYFGKLHADLEWAKLKAKNDESIKTISWSRFSEVFLANRPFPLFTWIVTVLCILVHFARLRFWYDGITGSDVFFDPNPFCLSWHEGLKVAKNDGIYKALRLSKKESLGNGKYYQFLTAHFVHKNLRHLIGNIVAMFPIGCRLEQIHGSVAIGIIYFSADISGSMASFVLDVKSGLFGASGGSFALYGVFFADVWTNWDLFEAKIDQQTNGGHTIRYLFLAWSIAYAMILWLAAEAESNTAHSCHLACLLFGFCLSLPLLRRTRDFDMHIKSTLNKNSPTQRPPVASPLGFWSRFFRCICFYGALVLISFMALRLWSYDGSPPLFCPVVRNVGWKCQWRPTGKQVFLKLKMKFSKVF